MTVLLKQTRSALVRVRDVYDRRSHPIRRERIRDVIRHSGSGPITFVCLGNICRSPYAEWRARRLAPGVPFRSAGFISPGRPPPEKALRSALDRGLDHALHRSRELTAEDVEASALFIVFDRLNVKRLKDVPCVDTRRVVWLGDLDPIWSGKRAIVDPWGRDQHFFDQTFGRIDRCVEALTYSINGRD